MHLKTIFVLCFTCLYLLGYGLTELRLIHVFPETLTVTAIFGFTVLVCGAAGTTVGSFATFSFWFLLHFPHQACEEVPGPTVLLLQRWTPATVQVNRPRAWRGTASHDIAVGSV